MRRFGRKPIAEAHLRGLLKSGAIDLVTFTSPSTVKNWIALAGDAGKRFKAAVIGPITAEAARAHGLEVAVEAATYTGDGLVAAIEKITTLMDKMKAAARTAVKLSVLDQSPVSAGMTPAEALQNTIELARLADRLGFTRYWIAEHHAINALASPAPEILHGAGRSGNAGDSHWIGRRAAAALQPAESGRELSGAACAVSRADRPRRRTGAGWHGPRRLRAAA